MLSHSGHFRQGRGILGVLKRLLSLPVHQETLPLAANGVKKNSCTDRWKDKDGEEDHVPATPSLNPQEDVGIFLIWHIKQQRHRKTEKLV